MKPLYIFGAILVIGGLAVAIGSDRADPAAVVAVVVGAALIWIGARK